ncbi:MAG: hypothetical protein H6972_16790 [Gammaproteobacteria bacterium]|nr:hypothetical protein [Gammaproteobacteria bacterium]
MTVYRKSFPEGTALLVHRLTEGSKDPNVLKRAQAVYCRAVFDLSLDQIAGLTGLAVSTIRRLHGEFLRFGMEIFDLSGRGGRRRQLMAPEEEVAFCNPLSKRVMRAAFWKSGRSTKPCANGPGGAFTVP